MNVRQVKVDSFFKVISRYQGSVRRGITIAEFTINYQHHCVIRRNQEASSIGILQTLHSNGNIIEQSSLEIMCEDVGIFFTAWYIRTYGFAGTNQELRLRVTPLSSTEMESLENLGVAVEIWFVTLSTA
jgi:hypothetical protein